MNNNLASLTMRLEADGLNYKKASDFQGVMFAYISDEYGDFLHQQQLHPYSQYIFFENDTAYWRINTLNEDAYDNVIVPLSNKAFNTFNIHNGNIEVTIIEKQIQHIELQSLLDEFYDANINKIINIEFRTLTAFKQRGRYNITPDLRLIYQSLMMKYSSIAGNDNMIDEETLDELAYNSQIISYNLFSSKFPMEGRNIPGFVGKLSIRFYGTNTMASYVRMLFRYGEFSGIGIKTGMGMGAIRIIEKEKDK